MEFFINNQNGIPIYIQLKEEIKLAIARSELKPGMQLPTVRQLAVQLRINPNTVSRVYSELEKEGFLATHQGRGTFVVSKPTVTGEARKNFDNTLEKLIWQAKTLGMSRENLLKSMLDKINESDFR